MSAILSQFFVLSLRGDTIISRDYRGDVIKGTPEIFFRHVKSIKGESVPIFNVEGINFLYLKQAGLYFVITSRHNVSPAFTLELLLRLGKVFKDYCGVLSEEAIRKNFVLIYELLDEIMDFGYVQGTTTESLKPFVYSDPILVDAIVPDTMLDKIIHANLKTTPSTSANKPVGMQESRGLIKDREEIFVDLVERLTVLFSSGGNVLRAEIEGSILMKSYLRGNPELRLGLNEDLVVGKGSQYGRVTMDDITFHESVKTNQFEFDRSLTLRPPDGEFVVLNYRISDDFRIPFRITPFIEELDSKRIDVIVKVRMDVPPKISGSNVQIRLPVPKSAFSASCELTPGAPGQQSSEYKANERTVVWTIKKFPAEQELQARFKITLTNPPANVRKEIGPISMAFEIPMHTCSNVTIRVLRMNDAAQTTIPYRWVRLITNANSYVYRL